jgi:histidinol-phosphate/aromatic aminotransferase/cobyric acid decarboxylase-like protein
VVDESYIDLYHTSRRPAHVCGLDERLGENVVTVGSFSKALAIAMRRPVFRRPCWRTDG